MNAKTDEVKLADDLWRLYRATKPEGEGDWRGGLRRACIAMALDVSVEVEGGDVQLVDYLESLAEFAEAAKGFGDRVSELFGRDRRVTKLLRTLEDIRATAVAISEDCYE